MKYNNSQKRVNRMSGLRCRKEILCIIAAIKASETNIEHLKFLLEDRIKEYDDWSTNSDLEFIEPAEEIIRLNKKITTVLMGA